MSTRLRRLLVPTTVLFVFLAARCASHDADAASTPASSAASGPGVSAAKFCPALLPKVQSFVKVPLTTVQANDETNDDLHRGDDGYVSCTYGNDVYRVTITMNAGDVSKYEGTNQQGFVPLAGFGDKARAYDGTVRWVDVVKRSTACETILSVADKDLTESDWKQVAGKMCNAAFTLYH